MAGLGLGVWGLSSLKGGYVGDGRSLGSGSLRVDIRVL